MTLVTALSGLEGVVLFADNQETVGGYSKKVIDKLHVWASSPFRFGIAGSANDSTYVDALREELFKCLLSLARFDIKEIAGALSEALPPFYNKHIRSADQRVEFLLVAQPLQGHPEVFHVCETAVNVVQEEHISIGVGAYLADYLSAQLTGGVETLDQLVAAAAFMAKEVRESIEGIGQVQRIAIFGKDGTYDEASDGEILELEDMMSQLRTSFAYMLDAATSPPGERARLKEELLSGSVNDIQKRFEEWRTRWARSRSGRAAMRDIRRNAV